MTEGKEWGKKKVALVFVISLIVCVVIVVVTLFAIKISKESDDSEELGYICPLSVFEETATCIEEAYVESGNVEEFVGMYDTAINSAKREDEYDLASELVMQRAVSLVDYGYCDMALRILDTEDFNGYDAGRLAYIYSRAASIGLECEDIEAREKWTNLMMEVQKELQYEAF